MNAKHAYTPPFGCLTVPRCPCRSPLEYPPPQYPFGAFQTATADRGKEFACYASLEATHGVQMYSQIRIPPGNGALTRTLTLMASCREFFPKGTDFAQISDEALETALHLINHRPRKCLGWKTANESFSEKLSHLAWQPVF